ncbi:glycerate kinase [Klebsiella pneumoniae]
MSTLPVDNPGIASVPVSSVGDVARLINSGKEQAKYARMIVFLALGGVFLDAYDLTTLSYGIDDVVREFQLSPLLTGLVTSSIMVGTIVGNIIGGWLTDKYGRYSVFMADMFFFVISAIAAGLAQALGAKLLTAEGQQIASGGGALETLARIDLSELDSRLADCRIDVACDVTNPLTGPQGASAVFGPQKGATAQMIDRLDSGLRHYARIIARDLDIDVLSLEGGGAAGGMGAALYAFCGAQLRPGIEIVTDALQLAERVADADLVITGEGRIDSQTIHGKVPVGVARVAKRFNVPVIGIAGSLTADVGVVHQHGLDAVFSVLYTICTLDEALANAAANLRMTARNVAAVLQMGDRR